MLLSKRTMASPSPENIKPLLIEPAEPLREPSEVVPLAAPRQRSNRWPAAVSLALSSFWVGGAAAYLLGYYGLAGLMTLPLQEKVLAGVLSFLPPVLFLCAAWALARGVAVTHAAETLSAATEKLFATDEFAARNAARLGRAVRHEIDALNAGLDTAFARLRALEGSLEKQVAAVNEAGARVGVQGEAVAARLGQERERIEGITTGLAEAAARAGETVAGRAAQLKTTMESAETALKSAGQSLDTQAEHFRQAVAAVAEAPRNAAMELDTQAKRIESVADAAMARAEFVLGRHERHRTAMIDLLQRLKEDGAAFESALSTQRSGLERAVAIVQSESRKLEQVVNDTDRQIDTAMTAAAARAVRFAELHQQGAEQVRETSETSHKALANLVEALRDAGSGAQSLIAEATSQARSEANALMTEAMAECERLLRVSNEMANEAQSIRQAMAKAAEELERHILNLPLVAQQEAQRVRQMVRNETEEMLDFSARTLSTIQARSESRPPSPAPAPSVVADEPEGDGLLGLAKRLTQRSRKRSAETPDARERESKPWEMSTLLAAAEGKDNEARDLKPGAAAAIGALQAALADQAIDLEAIVVDRQPSDETWRRYLAGERSAFAHRIAEAIDERAVDRIASLYRNDQRFHEAADNYLAEFEVLLSRAREGDGNGLLVSSILGADTGKIYLAVAYALGRL